MQAYAIVIKDHEVSETGYNNLKVSSEKFKNSFKIRRFDAITPKMARTVMSGNGLKWKYPWEGKETDLKTGLIKSAYQTANKNTRIACALSHWLLWHKCFTEDIPLLILEHDALFIEKLEHSSILKSEFEDIEAEQVFGYKADKNISILNADPDFVVIREDGAGNYIRLQLSQRYAYALDIDQNGSSIRNYSLALEPGTPAQNDITIIQNK